MKSTQIDRAQLVATLLSVTPGLTVGEENIEQSSCFVFKNGRVYTFNEEILCSAAVDIGITGAVDAKVMLSILQKMNEKSITFKPSKGELTIIGDRKSCGLRMEAKVMLPVDTVTIPTKWRKLPKGFISGLNMAQACASSSDAHFIIQCVNITPDMLEACDNTQGCRVKLATGLKSSALVRRDAALYLVNGNVTKMAEDTNWLHFRSPNKRVISVRRYMEKYPDWDSVFSFKGSPIEIPQGLAEAADKAAVFSNEDKSVSGRQMVSVDLSAGKLTIKGVGDYGWYKETTKLAYKGRDLKFAMFPDVLAHIAKKHSKAAVSENSLCVDGTNWRMIFCLFDSNKVKSE
jgi:hypothetical protein